MDKDLIFFLGVIIFVPIGIQLAKNNAQILNLVFIALVFGTTQPASLFGLPTDINFFSHEWYRGTTRGIEITYLDLLALILFFSSHSIRVQERAAYIKPAGFGYLKTYFIWCLLTVLLLSDPKIFGIFELTKIFRGMFIFLAVYAFMRSPEQVKLFVYVMVGIVFYEAAVALQDRYIFGINRIRATLPHPNSLSMYSLQVLPIVLSVWFSKDISPRLRQLCLISSVLVAGIIILTISRTGFAALVILAFGTIILNIRSQLTARNIGVLVMAVVIGLLFVWKSWDSLSTRFVSFNLEKEYLSDKGDRGLYFRKGMPAFYDKPIVGIGLNNWSYWISNRYAGEAGFNSETYPSVDFAPATNHQQAPAHNLYLLTAVELGLIGLLLLFALFLKWLYISGIGHKKPELSFLDRVRLGAFLSLCGVLMQSFTEWELRQTPMFFLLHITMSVAVFIYGKSWERNKN